MIVNSIQKSINQIDSLLDGWTFGRLVIESGKAYLQLESGTLIPMPTGAVLEVRNGNQWIPISSKRLQAKTQEDWPAYAGLEVRVR